jgi:hypothetical protein
VRKQQQRGQHQLHHVVAHRLDLVEEL